MFHFGTKTGFDFCGFQIVGIKRLSGTGAFGNEPGDALSVLMLIPRLNAKVPGIAEDLLLFTMQQFVGGHDVMNVRSGGIKTMNQPQYVIDTNGR